MKKILVCALLLVMVLSVVACAQKSYDNTIEFDQKDTKIIAHRGLSGLEVENTESAFIEAGKHSYYGIEADVRKTGDGQFVMCHDETLTRISGQEIAVENTPLDELLSVPLYDKDGEIGEERLTTLGRYIAICKEYDKQAILELKSDFTEAEIGGIIAVIASGNYIHRVTFISFDYDNLTYVRKYRPNQSAMYLFSEITDETTAKLARDKIDVAVNHKALSKKAVDEFHSLGLKVNCWTVDGKAEAERLVKMGVDYITTNILE
ncbi:MAG: hypothetical protein IJ033_01780 [Clostridia bacterium]|nr:hypothetical protein [Clostridia bacterium]